MRSAILVVLLASACFDEPPGPERTIIATTLPPAGDGDDESSSSSGESGEPEESSSSEAYDPLACPEWCTESCDVLPGTKSACRCFHDGQCDGGTKCMGAQPEPPNPVLGHCL